VLEIAFLTKKIPITKCVIVEIAHDDEEHIKKICS
jgi:hypothetical protein